MTRFLVRRFLQTLAVLFLMSFLVYFLIGLMPGDPVDMMISSDPHMTAEKAARLKELYGLNRPLSARYFNWLASALGGDFGYSRLYSAPVLPLMFSRLLSTLGLLIPSFLLTLLAAVPLGVHAARNPGGKADRMINLFSFAGISVPPFWLALMLISLFAVTLGLLPAGGTGTWAHLVLPVATLSLAGVGGYTRYVRSSMIAELSADHIKTARAKGCSERRVVWNHAFKSALIPLVTVIALDFGTLFSGALVTETMYARPGMGKTIYDAIMGNDYNLALIALLLSTAMIMAGNLLADIAYTALDPRIGNAE